MAHNPLTIDERMVEQASDIVNLALANRDLIIEIVRYERALGADKSWATTATSSTSLSPTMTDVSGIEVAHGVNCVVIMRQCDGRRWSEILRPNEADQLADAIRAQAAAARGTPVVPLSPRECERVDQWCPTHGSEFTATLERCERWIHAALNDHPLCYCGRIANEMHRTGCKLYGVLPTLL